MRIREAAFAGSWYPESAAACEDQITRFLAEGLPQLAGSQVPVGGIVPHAGWYFSGSIACNVISNLRRAEPPDVVAIFGMHLHPRSPNIIMTEGAWDTPFGALPVAESMAGLLTEQYPFQTETPQAFTPDNTIELQLPFIKYFFKDASILPIGLPPNQASLEIGQAVVEAGRKLDLKLVVIGSTDLTHYGPNYGFTPQGTGAEALAWVRDTNDRRIIDAMAAMDAKKVVAESVANQNACCGGAAGAAITAMRRLGAREGTVLAYATSHDRHPDDSFVGYVGMAFSR